MESFPSTFSERFTLVEESSINSNNVFTATEKSLDRQVAVKFIDPKLAREKNDRDKFLEEGNTLAKINHQNLVEVFDVDDNEERPFIVLQYVEGFSLKEEIARMGTIPVRHACDYMLQICEGLQAIHGEQLLHRNLKPRNIIIDRLGIVKILDFGFIASDGVSSAGEDGCVLGTPAYMSPEQAKGKTLGPASDIYALGVVFYEMVGGSTPFWGESPKAVMKKHVREKMPSLRTFNPLVPDRLRGIIYRMLRKDLSKRYDTVKKVSRDLNAFLSSNKWQNEIGDARKTFIKNEEDDEYTGVKGAIGSKERIKAARVFLDKKTTAKQKRKSNKAKKAKKRKKITWFRTVFIGFLLLLAFFLIFSDAKSVVKLKNLISKYGMADVKDMEVLQRGNNIIVTWHTDSLSAGDIKLCSPVSQYFHGSSYKEKSKSHHCIIDNGFKDGEKIEFVIVGNDGVESPLYSYVFTYNPLIKDIKITADVVTAFVEVATSELTSCSLEIKGHRAFVSNGISDNHMFSIGPIPANSSYTAEVTIKTMNSGKGNVNIYTMPVLESKVARFKTREPEYSTFFVTPSGKPITYTPLVYNDSIFFADEEYIYAISAVDGQLLWSTKITGPTVGSPVVNSTSLYVNLTEKLISMNLIDGSILLQIPSSEGLVHSPFIMGNESICVTEKGEIKSLDLKSGKTVWAVNTKRELSTSVVVDNDLIFTVDNLGYATCRNITTGREVWSLRTGNKLVASPIIFEKYLLLPAMDGNFYAIYKDRGIISWRKTSGNLSSSPALVKEASARPGEEDEYIYYLAAKLQERKLFKLNVRGGSEIWQTVVNDNVKGTPVVSEGRVYVTGSDGTVYCFSATKGSLLWSVDTGSELKGNLLVAEGCILAINYQGSIIRIKD